MGFDMDKPKSGAKSKIPKKRKEQIEWYVGEIDDNAKKRKEQIEWYLGEIDDNAKQFAMEFNKLPTS